MKRIFFTPQLIEKMRSSHPPQVTYRKTRRHGVARVVSGSWIKPKEEGILLGFNGSEEVDPRILTDEDAQLAGIATAQELLTMFRGWYGQVPSRMYRNGFNILEGSRCPECGAPVEYDQWLMGYWCSCGWSHYKVSDSQWVGTRPPIIFHHSHA